MNQENIRMNKQNSKHFCSSRKFFMSHDDALDFLHASSFINNINQYSSIHLSIKYVSIRIRTEYFLDWTLIFVYSEYSNIIYEILNFHILI